MTHAIGARAAVLGPLMDGLAWAGSNARDGRPPTIMVMASVEVRIPYVVEQDEDGVWCAHAQLRPRVGAHGEGDTADAAVADLREALNGLIAEFGVPRELTLTMDVA